MEVNTNGMKGSGAWEVLGEGLILVSVHHASRGHVSYVLMAMSIWDECGTRKRWRARGAP